MNKEIIARKAFRCTFDRWFDVDYRKNDAYAETIYASTAGKARYAFFRETERDKEWFAKIKVRRAKHLDLLVNEPHPMAETIEAKRLDMMKHAWGFDSNSPGYRNYFATHNDKDWDAMCESGLAVKGNTDESGMIYYHVSPLGIEVLKSLKPYPRPYQETA